MPTTKKGAAPGKGKRPIHPPPTKTKRSGIRRNGSEVLVWSEVGMSVPVGDTYAHLRFSFGHERFAKSDSLKDLKETSALVDEFNEEELDRRTRKYMRLVKQILNEDEDSEEEEKKRRRRGRK